MDAPFSRRSPLGLRAAAVLALAGMAGSAAAHHGIANFDLNKDVAFEGTVSKLAFVNPHSWLYVDVVEANAEARQWQCEMRSSTVLRRSGWSEAMFSPGTKVRVTGSPDRTAPNTCYLATVTFADGTSMDRYGQLRRSTPLMPADRPERLANNDPNIGGDWAGEQRVMTDRSGLRGALVPISVADRLAPGELPEGVRAFPGARGTPESLADNAIRAAWTRPSAVALTPEGQRAAEGFDPASSADNPRLRCEPTNILFDWTFETFTNRITQNERTIRIQYGAPGIDRTIHLDETEHPAAPPPSVTGHSIGHWENDVLVVDTVGFAPGVLSADTRTLHSGQLHVVERFMLDRERAALRREYVAEDPLYFAGEYRGADTVYVADLPYAQPSCTDLSYATDRGTAAAAPEPPAKPWWMFWK
jgi:Family of unknown function (DUF6152)